MWLIFLAPSPCPVVAFPFYSVVFTSLAVWFYLVLRKLGCFGRCDAFLLELAQLWSLLGNFVKLFFPTEIAKQNCPNWHVLLEEDWVNMLLLLLICKISPKNSSRGLNELCHRCFPRDALLMGVPRDQRAIVLGIVPFVVTEILFTLSESGSFSTHDSFFLFFLPKPRCTMMLNWTSD